MLETLRGGIDLLFWVNRGIVEIEAAQVEIEAVAQSGVEICQEEERRHSQLCRFLSVRLLMTIRGNGGPAARVRQQIERIVRGAGSGGRRGWCCRAPLACCLKKGWIAVAPCPAVMNVAWGIAFGSDVACQRFSCFKLILYADFAISCKYFSLCIF
jgi:hypothetical protein